MQYFVGSPGEQSDDDGDSVRCEDPYSTLVNFRRPQIGGNVRHDRQKRKGNNPACTELLWDINVHTVWATSM